MKQRLYSNMAILTALFGCVSLQGYLVRVVNNTAQTVWIAVYQQQREQLLRRSKPRLLESGQAVWIGGVHENDDAVTYALYGAQEKDFLVEEIDTLTAITTPISYLINVGNGERLFALNDTASTTTEPQPLSEIIEQAVLNALESSIKRKGRSSTHKDVGSVVANSSDANSEQATDEQALDNPEQDLVSTTTGQADTAVTPLPGEGPAQGDATLTAAGDTANFTDSSAQDDTASAADALPISPLLEAAIEEIAEAEQELEAAVDSLEELQTAISPCELIAQPDASADEQDIVPTEQTI